MASHKSLPVESRELHVPPLNELKEALSDGLAAYFAHVSVQVVECPDLSQAPFHLAAPGIGGEASIVDLGGVPYLVPSVRRDRLYDLRSVPALIGMNEGSVAMIGAGAGPWPHLNTNCEMMTNLRLGDSGEVQLNGTRLATVDGHGSRKLHSVPDSETGCALLNNLLVTRGRPATPVLRVNCEKRTAPENFVTCLRKIVNDRYPDQVVGMGGVFILDQGRAKLHVMPDFSACPLETDDDVNKWLHFYEAQGPLINLSVFVSHDPGLDLRVEHTHCFSVRGDGGHYHEDVTPDTVSYEAYLTPAERIFRIDRPESTHNVGRD